MSSQRHRINIYVYLFVVSLFNTAVAQTSYDSLYLKNVQYKNLIDLYESLKTERADIVFLGNSITFGGKWPELLGREKVANRGIGSDNIPGMLHRLDQIYRLQPKICFLMAGINDLYSDIPVDTVFARYITLIDSLRSRKIIPIIQSTLHVNPKWKRAKEKNIEVFQLNTLLQRYALQHSVLFVDVNAQLSSDSTLKDEYTTDGVHLTVSAYACWCDILEPVLKRHGL